MESWILLEFLMSFTTEVIMDINDDMSTDRLDYLADKHAELFFWIEQEFAEDELPPEPSAAELAYMDEQAEQLLKDLEEDDDNRYGNL